MTVIVNKRDFLPSFVHRNVVGEATVISTISNELRFRVLVDFGLGGKLCQYTTVSIGSKNLANIVKEIEEYLDDIKVLIAGLEDFSNWVTNEDQVRFLQTLDIKRPIMITGLRGYRSVRMGIHGEELMDFSIVVDTRKDPGASSICRRISDIVDVFQHHVTDVSNINIIALLSKGASK